MTQIKIDFGDNFSYPDKPLPPSPNKPTFKQLFKQSLEDDDGLLWLDALTTKLRTTIIEGKEIQQIGIPMNKKYNYIKTLHNLINDTQRDDVKLAAIKFVMSLDDELVEQNLNLNDDNTIIKIDDLTINL